MASDVRVEVADLPERMTRDSGYSAPRSDRGLEEGKAIMRRTVRRKRAFFTATAVAAAATVGLVSSLPASAEPPSTSLEGEVLAGSTTSAPCDPTTPGPVPAATYSFSASGSASAPYLGAFTEKGYITVGTGIGVGVVRGGEVYRGLAHVEMGHIPVSVIEGDEFSGSCPFHGTCLEGMASGKALEDRLGAPAVDLVGESQDRAMSLLAGYLGQGLRAMAYTFAPERVVIGGGVSAMPGFFDAVRVGFLAGLGGYLRLPEYSEPGYLSPAELSGRSGLMGGLIIAEGGL